MYKKTIKYIDFNGEPRTEDFYFNLSLSELTKKELSTPGGWSNKLQQIADSKDVTEIVKAFNEIIDMSYGVKSDDGRRFIKSKEATEEFKESPAYDEFFMSIVTDPNAAVDFMNAIIPDTSKYAKAGNDSQSGVIKFTTEK